MTWIRTIDLSAAEGELRELYAQAVDPATGQLDNILRVHSLRPDGLRAHLMLYTSVMRPTRSLPKAEREMIALTVSKLNGCHY